MTLPEWMGDLAARVGAPAVSKMPEGTCGTWVQTHIGHAVDLADPKPATIEPHDIAVALARIPRFNGHTVEMFSVAQHSVLTLDIADAIAGGTLAPAARLAVLLHDAHEAYMGDITRPVLSLPGMAVPLRALKARLDDAIHARFGLPSRVGQYRWREMIREADEIALATEKRDLMTREPMPWGLSREPWSGIVLDLGTRYDMSRRFYPLLRRLVAEVAA